MVATWGQQFSKLMELVDHRGADGCLPDGGHVQNVYVSTEINGTDAAKREESQNNVKIFTIKNTHPPRLDEIVCTTHKQ